MQHAENRRSSTPQDASGLHIGIVVSRYNPDITEALLVGAQETLAAWQVPKDHISVVHVAGSFELPYGASFLISQKPELNAVIVLGCIVKGETEHDRHIAGAVAQGLMDLSLATQIPVSFGVLTVNTMEQAVARTVGEANKGKEAAIAALESALLHI